MRALWLRCWWELALAVVALRTRWRWRYLNIPLAPERQASADAERIWRTLWRVSFRHVKRISCLEYAAALHRMLKRRGIDCRQRIGVKEPYSGEEVVAHAWVELPDGTRLEIPVDGMNYLPLESCNRP